MNIPQITFNFIGQESQQYTKPYPIFTSLSTKVKIQDSLINYVNSKDVKYIFKNNNTVFLTQDKSLSSLSRQNYAYSDISIEIAQKMVDIDIQNGADENDKRTFNVLLLRGCSLGSQAHTDIHRLIGSKMIIGRDSTLFSTPENSDLYKNYKSSLTDFFEGDISKINIISGEAHPFGGIIHKSPDCQNRLMSEQCNHVNDRIQIVLQMRNLTKEK